MKILVAADGSGYSHASLDDLRRAGLPQHANVVALSIAEIWLPTVKREDAGIIFDEDCGEYLQKRDQQAGRNLNEAEIVASEAKNHLSRNFPGWDIKTIARSGSPASEILKMAIEFDPDLIVMGSRGLSSEGETGLGSISQKVLTEAHCSVRIARCGEGISSLPKRIAIGFDGSLGSQAAVKAVAARRWGEHCEIRLMTVADPLFPTIIGRALQPIPGWSEKKVKGEQLWVEKRAANALLILHQVGLTAALHVYSGNPRMVLAEETRKWPPDCMFVGANSRNQLHERFGVGCVSSAMAARLACSVEIIRIK